MKEPRILLISYDANIRNTVKRYVLNEKYLIDEAENGISALKLARRSIYDIVVLDRDIPDIDPWHICRNIKNSSGFPLIVLSSQSTEEEMLSYFDIGADDFMHKPFSCRELIARMKVILKYTKNIADTEKNITYDDLYIDIGSHEVYVQERTVKLSPKEFALLKYLAGNPNKSLSREKILVSVWGDDFFGSDRTVDAHIKSLRQKIRPYDKFINTVWGYGYIFKT